MIPEAIYSKIEHLVDGRCYPVKLPERAVFPALTYLQVGEEGRWQISCWAETYAEAKELARDVTDEMDDFIGTDTSVVRKSVLEYEQDLIEPEVGVYQVAVELLLLIQKYDPPTVTVWTKLLNYPGAGRRSGIMIACGSKIYMGLGQYNLTYRSDWYEYDPATNTYTAKTDFPNAVINPYGFTIGTKVYVGGGADTYPDALVGRQDFYEYDTLTDTWTEKTNFGVATVAANGLAANNKGYVFFGTQGQVREYDPTTDTWMTKTNCPNFPTRQYAAAVSINDKIYAGLGTLSGAIFSDWLEYNPATDVWTIKENFGSTRYYTVSFTANNYGIVGGGLHATYTFMTFWKYNPTTDKWGRVEVFPSGVWPRDLINVSGTGIGSYGYVGITEGQAMWRVSIT